MRSSNSKMIGNGITSTGTPVENGLPQKESLPTIQIDTVPSPLSSPTDLSPVSAQSNEEPLDTSHIDIDLEEEQTSELNESNELKESLKSYIEDILSKAMVIAEKKIKFVGFDDNKDENQEVKEQSVPQQSSLTEPEDKCSNESDEAEIRAAAEKVVDEVLTKAQDTVREQIEQFEKEIAALDFPGLPSIQIDTVKSAPPSPELEEEPPRKQTKWSFTMKEDSDVEKTDAVGPEKLSLITFDEAPECVKDVASDFVKEIVGKAIAQAEEKAVPTVPFNFEDVDLMKTNGPWYVRVREAFVRVLRTACFCTPRRNDS